MNYSFPAPRNCRNLLISSRVRRNAMAERLDKQWCDLRHCATIEVDQKKLWLLADTDKRRRQAEALRQQS